MVSPASRGLRLLTTASSAGREHAADPGGQRRPVRLGHCHQTRGPGARSRSTGRFHFDDGNQHRHQSSGATFAALALILASVGLYGVMALTVTQRTRELGIRMALGAARSDVFRLVLIHGALLVSIGIVLGLLGAIAASHALQAVLYGVGPLDLPAFAMAIVGLAFIALFACFLPARRAT